MCGQTFAARMPAHLHQFVGRRYGRGVDRSHRERRLRTKVSTLAAMARARSEILMSAIGSDPNYVVVAHAVLGSHRRKTAIDQLAPVTKLASSEQKPERGVRATSSGTPTRPSGICRASLARTSSRVRPAVSPSSKGVSMKVGWSELQVILPPVFWRSAAPPTWSGDAPPP